MKKIMLVFGTRPEAIKMAPLVKCLQERDKEFETIVCVTGQHREMLDQVLKIFDIDPEFDLNIMKPGQDLYDITSWVLLGMRDVFHDVAKAIDSSLSDEDIYGYFDDLTSGDYMKENDPFGTMLILYVPDKDLSSGHSRGHIGIDAQ